ncbi:UNVERIFIED_CONTAM: hypothetical protein GTU68_053772 [Idotea baltica]|nr:hypothetical protein [Idotea baltica]
MIPGELFPAEGDIELNAGLETVTVDVANTGDRPIQVGSHYHFYETNEGLSFDREKTRGMRLDIPAGTATARRTRGMRLDIPAGTARVAVRTRPARSVTLVPYRGDRTVLRVQSEDHWVPL